MKKPVDVPKLLRALGIDAEQHGREWLAMCPNPKCEGRRPHFRMRDAPMSSKHGFWKCWSCGEKGGPNALVMLIYGFAEQASAREWLRAFNEGESAEQDEVASAEWEIEPRGQQEEFKFPIGVEFDPLESWPDSAKEYAKSRGITEEQVDRFGIGYATFGRLAGRIVFPARDRNGNPKGYAARTFIGAPKRYLSSDSHDNPDRTVMFGEHLWPTTRLRVVALEGAINGLVIDRATGDSFGVIDGSEPRIEHIRKLATFPLVIVMTDPDAAGEKAAATLMAALWRWVKVKRAITPNGMDARETEEKFGSEAIVTAIEEARAA